MNKHKVSILLTKHTVVVRLMLMTRTEINFQLPFGQLSLIGIIAATAIALADFKVQ